MNKDLGMVLVSQESRDDCACDPSWDNGPSLLPRGTASCSCGRMEQVEFYLLFPLGLHPGFLFPRRPQLCCCADLEHRFPQNLGLGKVKVQGRVFIRAVQVH